jgi:6-phosphofructo-2-kinase/fructose-2,6-biphosphatase 2
LDELDPGDCDGLSYEEIEQRFPQEFRARDGDKYNYRYNGNGESYADLVQRLEPLIMELERMRMNRTHTVFIIGHQAVIRCIYAYFMNYSKIELPYLKVCRVTVFNSSRSHSTLSSS